MTRNQKGRKSEAERILEARFCLLESAAIQSTEELLRSCLDELEKLTNSRIGFYHFLEADQRTLSLQAWSSRTLRDMCTAEGKGRHYDVAEAGVWTDCLRERRPIVHNDYATLPRRKGMPPGHAKVIRELVVPVIRGDKIMAILGVGNKPRNYTDRDIQVVSRLGDLAWDIVERQRSEAALREAATKYRVVAENTYDWEWWKDPAGNFLYVSPSCKNVTGREREEFIADPDRLLEIIHPDDRSAFVRHQSELEQTTSSEVLEFRIIRPDGATAWIAHACQPVFDEQGRYLGRRGSNRDITERKRMEEDLRESERKLRHLSAQLMTAQETERRRISRELHDELGGALAVLKLRTRRIEKALPKDRAEIGEQCRENLRSIDQIIDNVRRLSRDLSPSILQDIGLTPALRWLIDNFVKNFGHHVKADLADIDGLFPEDSQIMIYRIFQEALTNIGKHARASNVSVAIRKENDSISCRVEDDGKGFKAESAAAKDPSEKGLGLTSMVERARMLGGVLEFRSERERGTRIVFRIPVKRGEGV